ncbi:restriction endonuclease subunit S [Lactiplantibacillus plantarum]|uniref:restriction endonuclease subunit S n=1 Tax=Lactiplantibacillus plantarum TaxID=1590 RepID=UPI0021823462|nr:restriction endonuclease subunit S [Lactiplantibacillus plantarum]MCS8622247.1 restriction endonuclease subunit S [Lactiplantibacillus plantarum]
MKDNQAKYPQLRFKGFTDPWEQCKLGEVATFINGRAYKQNELLDSGKYKVLRVGNFYTNDSWYYSNMELGDKYYIDKGDLVYTWSATFGPHIWNGEKVIYHYHIWKVELSKLLDRDFTLQLLEADKARLLSNTNGSTMIHVTKGDMESKSVTIPNIDEQNQIGTFFQHLDHLITLHQRKLAKLKELKQGYLQKMFPQNGSKFPQLRFAGFADAWEQRKLGEEAQLTMGQSPNSENYTKNPDDYILVQGNADMKNGRVVPRVWTTQITKKAEKSDLILSVRAPVGDIGKTDYDVVLGRGVAAIKGNEFIFQQLGKMKLTGYWTRYSTGSTFESINSNDIKDAKIMVPVEEEQQKIGAFFKQLDDTIVLHQRKLEKLQELKKGYLQKMFC